jgi:putative transferase (TIGR04331 family)
MSTMMSCDYTKLVLSAGKQKSLRLDGSIYLKSNSGYEIYTIWDDKNKFIQDAHFQILIYDTLLIEVSNYLNTIHKTNKSVRAWGIIVGSWLKHFIENVHYRYESVKYVTNDCNNIIIKIGKQEDVVVSNDYSDYMKRIEECELNESIYISILSFMGLHLVKQKLINKTNPDYNLLILRRLYIKIKNTVNNCISYMLGDKISVIISGMNHLNIKDYYNLFVKSNRLIRPFFTYKMLYENHDLYHENRKDLTSITTNTNKEEIYELLLSIVMLYIPKSYVEYYNQYNDLITKSLLTNNVKLLVTEIGIYHDENFKYLAAHYVDQGAKLIICQHGGTYGMIKFNTLEILESSIADEYWTWGWKGQYSNTVQMPSYYLSNIARNRSNVSNNTNQHNILYVMTELPRFHNRTCSIPVGYQFSKYMNNSFKFINAVHKSKKNNIKMRAYWRSRGWDSNAMVLNKYPSLASPSNSDIYTEIDKSKMVVIDFLGTTMLELLSLKKPFLLLLDLELLEPSKEFLNFIEILKNHNILFETPEQIAEYVNNVDWEINHSVSYNNLIDDLKNTFALVDNNWETIWIKRMSQIIKTVKDDELYKKSC